MKTLRGLVLFTTDEVRFAWRKRSWRSTRAAVRYIATAWRDTIRALQPTDDQE
jgi:hypothetical protein